MKHLLKLLPLEMNHSGLIYGSPPNEDSEAPFVADISSDSYGGDPSPKEAAIGLELVAAVNAYPSLRAFVRTIARMTSDGEMVNGKEFVMENDDAVSTLCGLIESARSLLEGI